MVFTPLIAAAEWLNLVIPIVFIIIYALNHLISAAKGKTPPVRNPQRRPPEGERAFRPPQQQPPKPPASSQSQLNSEIEQFLKRANSRRNEGSKREPAPPVRAKKAPPRQLVEQPVDVQPLAREERSSVTASVEKHLANRSFTQRAEHLADDIVRADEQMEEHLQKAFNRRVGSLSDTSPKASSTPTTDTETAVTSAAPSAANLVGAMLRNPDSLKQAIILNEVLKRPEERW